MAIPTVHKRITEAVLGEQGFTTASINMAAEANAAVDDKQGDQAPETNLHAMRGYLEGTMQTEEQTRQAVRLLVDQARRDILNAIAIKSYIQAIRRMGEILHTIQDGAIHHFEAWPYTSISNAIWSNPAYMAMHGLRDLCLSPYVVAGSAPLNLGRFGVAAETGVSTYFSNRWLPDTIGLRGDYLAGGDRPPQMSGLLTLCWGACPGTGASPSSRSSRPGPLDTASRSASPEYTAPSAVFQPEWTYELKIRPEVLVDAENESRKFVESVKQAAGSGWNDFVKS